MRWVFICAVLLFSACAHHPRSFPAPTMATASYEPQTAIAPSRPPPQPPPPLIPGRDKHNTVSASVRSHASKTRPVTKLTMPGTEIASGQTNALANDNDNDNESSQETATSSTKLVDDVLSQLVLGKVAFNSPEKINIEETVTIKVVLSPNETEAALLSRVDEPGKKTSESLQVSNLMEAHLHGEGFKIVAVTPERQAVSSGVTEWIWDVTPLAAGKRQLSLTIDALITVNGEVVPKTLRTYRKPIEVEVTNAQKLDGFIGEHGKWLWTTLLVPFFGWIMAKRKAKAEKTEANKPA